MIINVVVTVICSNSFPKYSSQLNSLHPRRVQKGFLMKVTFHGYGIIHILVHGGISRKGVERHEETGREDGPPKDILEEPKQKENG